MTETVLVTGGAGFIGSFLVDALVERGHNVRIYDALVPQVHGPEQALPTYLNPEADFVKGDMRDRDALARALRGVDVVYHLAAAVGVGQSMYEIQYYTEANTLGGAVLLDLGRADLDRDSLIAAMIENPILIERPIVVSDKGAAVGRPPETVLAIL